MLLLFLLVDIALLPGLPVVPLPVLLLLLFISLLLFLFVTILPTGEEALNFYNLCSTFFKSTKVPVHNLTLRKPFTQCKKSIIIIIIIYNNEQTENYEPGTESYGRYESSTIFLSRFILEKKAVPVPILKKRSSFVFHKFKSLPFVIGIFGGFLLLYAAAPGRFCHFID